MSELPQRQLGTSGLRVSEICLGTMMFGDQTGEDEARRIADHAAERGVNFIDTADVYCEGRSEEITGRLIKSNRHHWTLATKVGAPYRGAIAEPRSGGLSRRWLMLACERSLRRLSTDHIDIYYVHKTDETVPWSDIVCSFGDLIRQGKIRYWGLSNLRAWHIPEIVHQCRNQNVPLPAALQPYYNIMNRQPETELLPAAREYGLGIVPYSPIARGILSGKYRPGETPPEGSRAGRKDARMLQSEWRPESIEIAQTLQAHAEAKGATLIDFAVSWVLANRAISSVIAGPRTFAQWENYFGYRNYRWTGEDEALVDSLVAPGHPSTPGYNDPSYPLTGRFSSLIFGQS